MSDHERIWLQPSCPTCRGIDDRTWCQDNVWSEGCSPGDCAVKPTEYVRADLVTPPSTVAALVEALKAADQFIRNGIELGFIRMPSPSTPDPAHDTPGKVSAALARVRRPA